MNDSGKFLSPRNPILWIGDREKFLPAVESIRSEKEIGLDVETTLEDPPRLCTIQIATRQRNFVFDAIAIEDLSPLFQIVEDPLILKIIHYAPFEQAAFGTRGVKVRNIFDTFQVSRKLRGEKDRYYHSLARVCRRELDRSLDKTYQKADWRRRPLTAGQLRYAALDAEVMLDLYDVFRKELPQLELPL